MAGNIYIQDGDGNYTIPIYTEYRGKILTVGTVVQLLKGVTVNHDTVMKGIDNNLFYGRNPDSIALCLQKATENNNEARVYIRPSYKNTCGYRLFIEDNNCTKVLGDYKIPKDCTTLSAVLFGEWTSYVEEDGPDVATALEICGLGHYVQPGTPIMIKGAI